MARLAAGERCSMEGIWGLGLLLAPSCLDWLDMMSLVTAFSSAMLLRPPAAAASKASLAFCDISAVGWGLRGEGGWGPGGPACGPSADLPSMYPKAPVQA